MAQALRIGLLGCGTVGTGVARILSEKAQQLARIAGRPLELCRVVVRDPSKSRDGAVPQHLLSTDPGTLCNDPLDVVVEVAGGTGAVRDAVLKCLGAGRDLVTANKALLAEYGPEIFEKARKHGRAIGFEAAVAGGIPIIRVITEGMVANRITAIQGILNGTSNYILSKMTDEGLNYADVLAEAQKLGYAEADPTLDVDGTDAAHKLSILAHLAFGVQPPLESIPRRGIDGIDAVDIRFASELGYTIRLLAESWNREGKLAMHVSPVLLRKQAPLAQVRGAYNAVALVGDAVEDTLYYGKGAGMLPTASSIVADLVDLAVSRERMVHRTGLLWPVGVSNEPAIIPDTDLKSRFYLRLLLPDRPGIMAEVAGILATHRISIASVIQHESTGSPDSRVQMVIMTHEAPTSDFRMAVEEINRRGFAVLPVTHYPVAD